MNSETEKVKVTTLKELGRVLPIGIFNGGVFKRDFTLREMGYPIDKAIGRFKRLNENLPNTAVVSKLVSLLASSIGGEQLEFTPDDNEQQEAEALIKIGQMFLADVFYIYVMARIEEIGSKYKIDFVCSNCGFISDKMETDLNEMDVSVVHDKSVLRREVPLSQGVHYRDGTIKKSVFIQPMLWANMVTNEVKEAGGDSQLMKLHFVKHCIVGVEGVEEAIALTEPELDSLRKIDIENISYEINKINVGPSLRAVGKCPVKGCEMPFLWSVNWDYDHFFTISSL